MLTVVSMGQELEEIVEYGPAMSELTQLQRNFVNAWCEHSNYTPTQLAAEAGYAPGNYGSQKVTAHHLMHNDKVLAAMNEEASKRLRSGGLIGVSAVVAIALNPSHKDHLKAALALMDRTGFHAMSEHKVTVDDKRPQTKQELIDAVKVVAAELGLDTAAIKQLTGEDIVEGEFVEVLSDEQIKQMTEDM